MQTDMNQNPQNPTGAAGADAGQDQDIANTAPGQLRVIKRNGKVVSYDDDKITVAISKAFLAVEGGTAAASSRIHETVARLTEQVSATFKRRMPSGGTIHIEEIQDQVELALMRNGEAVAAMKEAEWEIASHGLKWIEHADMAEEEEREQIREAIRIHEEVTGARPMGWYTGRCSMQTQKLILEEGGFLYDSDSYADDLPYWVEGPDGDHLVIPYALDTNDMRFASVQGFNSGDQFFTYLKDAFDTLYDEGRRGSPKMLNIGLHCRLAGRPGRAAALASFLDYIASHADVWVTRRIDIAWHWHAHHGRV